MKTTLYFIMIVISVPLFSYLLYKIGKDKFSVYCPHCNEDEHIIHHYSDGERGYYQCTNCKKIFSEKR